MDNDIIFTGVLISFPLAVGLGVAVMLLIQRAVCSTSCPACGKRIPKAAVTEHGVECDSCVENRAQPLVPRGATCNQCNRQLDTTPCIQLWDGRNYCEECVTALNPELLHYAAHHPVLKETMPFPAWK